MANIQSFRDEGYVLTSKTPKQLKMRWVCQENVVPNFNIFLTTGVYHPFLIHLPNLWPYMAYVPQAQPATSPNHSLNGSLFSTNHCVEQCASTS